MKEKVTPLFVIEVEDIHKPPTVYYKGKKIEMKKSVNYEWESDGELSLGTHNFQVEHYEKEKEERTGVIRTRGKSLVVTN